MTGPQHPADTIVATSSPAGRSPRAIIRLSGPQAVRIASAVFASEQPLDLLPSYSSAAGFVVLPREHIRCPATAYVMPAPRSLHEVFRSVREAATALHEVLDDTASFAREIYGMIDSSLTDDDRHEDRPAFTVRQLRGFLNSPLGDELATRIQFQPAYHGLVESDVVLINTGVGGMSSVVDESVRRLERLLARLRGRSARKNVLFCCDPVDPQDPMRKKLIKTLKALHSDLDR